VGYLVSRFTRRSIDESRVHRGGGGTREEAQRIDRGCGFSPRFLSILRAAAVNGACSLSILEITEFDAKEFRLLSVLYSYLKHSIGSRRDAFFAGQTPKIKPTAIETVNPLRIAQSGIEAGSSGRKNMMT
jgi:hypothetical protein